MEVFGNGEWGNEYLRDVSSSPNSNDRYVYAKLFRLGRFGDRLAALVYLGLLVGRASGVSLRASSDRAMIRHLRRLGFRGRRPWSEGERAGQKTKRPKHYRASIQNQQSIYSHLPQK